MKQAIGESLNRAASEKAGPEPLVAVTIGTVLTQSTVSIKTALRKPFLEMRLRRAEFDERRGQDSASHQFSIAVAPIAHRRSGAKTIETIQVTPLASLTASKRLLLVTAPCCAPNVHQLCTNHMHLADAATRASHLHVKTPWQKFKR